MNGPMTLAPAPNDASLTPPPIICAPLPESQLSVHLYRKLVVWKKARAFVSTTYRTTRKFPRSEQYGLARQPQRAAISIPSNIAEGNGSGYRRTYAHHVAIAHGSLMEVETRLLLTLDLEYLDQDEVAPLLELGEELGRLLRALRRSLERSGGGE